MDQPQQTGSDKLTNHAGATHDWLQAYRPEIQREFDTWSTAESRWSWSRLAVFVVWVIFWLYWGLFSIWPYLLTIVAIVVFAWTVRRHHHARAERILHEHMLTVMDESQRRCGGHVELIRDGRRPESDNLPQYLAEPVLESGRTWPLTDQERDDLDLYGRGVGVFGLLNRTSSRIGAIRLSNWLDNPCLEPDRIQARQTMIRWLVDRPIERTRLLAAAAGLRREDDQLLKFARAAERVEPLELDKTEIPLRIWSVISFLCCAVATVQMMNGVFLWGWLIGLCVLVNALILRKIGARLHDAIHPWREAGWGGAGLLNVARQAITGLPNETGLQHLRASFEHVVRPDILPSLCRRIDWAEHGGSMHALLNYTMLMDLHVGCAIHHRAHPHQHLLREALRALADLEALLSLACFAAEQPVTCYPQITEEVTLRVTGGQHPLIPPDAVVPNDITLSTETHLWIITGSNMAGKSTLLRVAGVSGLLAQLGSVVTAKNMIWRPLRLISDLGARDNLADGESYFLAEVRHVRRMVLPPEGDDPVLGLIDEPFRGTNSQEQTAGSVGVIRYLLKTPHLFLLATHDRHLTELADGKRVRNFHFRENLGAAGLVFDYLLHDGPAQTRNALRVLEREGYPQVVLDDAHRWLEERDDQFE